MASEWKPVLGYGGYWPGFKPDAELEFKRFGSEVVTRFRLHDQSGYFNVADLYWRERPAPTERKEWTSIAAYRG